ncbi:winged helix-turn-helix transcriptional regulator [Candidatus Pacearchaeota archaeon]|nr:winged helix-turn-helix transcriptional regulator [Candidatus Pacearchaeota archaeon]
MAQNSIMVELEDPRAEVIAEVLTNKTAKKILGLLSEREMSGSEIANELGVPINTISYNMKKLIDSGIAEKTNKILWSVKGRKMDIYRIVNKRIVISPRQRFKGILPALIGSVLVAFGLKIWSDARSVGVAKRQIEVTSDILAQRAGEFAAETATKGQSILDLFLINENIWIWFLIGALTGLTIFIVWNFWSWGRK